MSIEKLSDESRVIVENTPFTMIPNSVIAGCQDNDAFRLYCYLMSKSRDWKVVKEYAAKICQVGEKKARKCWSYLQRCGLIEYIVVRDEKGVILKHDIIVKNGTNFDKTVEFENKKLSPEPTGAESAPVDAIHRGKNPPSGEPTRVGFAPLPNKENTQQRLEALKKDKSFCSMSLAERKAANEKKHDFWNGQKPPLASVENQTTSFKPLDFDSPPAPMSPLLAEHLKKVTANDSTQLPARPTVQPQMAESSHAGAQGAQHAACGT